MAKAKRISRHTSVTTKIGSNDQPLPWVSTYSTHADHIEIDARIEVSPTRTEHFELFISRDGAESLLRELASKLGKVVSDPTPQEEELPAVVE